MAITPATAFGTQMTKIVGNAGGAIFQEVESYWNGKVRCFRETVTYAAQASGVVIGVARIPTPFVLLGITMNTDTSSGTATIALGNAANGNSAIYKAAAVFTAVNTPTPVGLVSALKTPITQGIDCITGLPTTYDRGQSGGGGYEDIILTTGAAAAPASGTLLLDVYYMID